ncbi:MAG: hypothetical protein JW724_07995 [Candidatus Altiarchaeota archaeon]|nr:hypothetical protein [Candidatus Altiarchaeota archaeon]
MKEKKTPKDAPAKEKKPDGEDEEKGVKAVLSKQEEALDDWMDKTKDRLEVGNWLKKARKHEHALDYKKALESYLKFVEAKLDEIKKHPTCTLKDYLRLVRYYLKIAECYERITHTTAGGKKRDMDHAGTYYVKAAEMYVDMERYDEAYDTYVNAARCYSDVESFAHAANAYIDAGLMHYRIGKVLMACSSFIKGAQFYEKAGEYEKSSQAYLKAAELKLDTKDVYSAINCYKKAGECYDMLGEPREAIKYYIKSAELSSTVERYSDVADRYEGIAKGYERLEDWKNAIFYHLHAAELDIANDPLAASYAYDNVAKCYSKLKDYEKTIDYYKKSVEIRTDIKKYAEAAAAAYEIAGVYAGINDQENAANYFFQHAEYAANDNPEASKEGYMKAAKLYEDMAKAKLENDREKAIENFLEAAKCYDRLEENNAAAELYVKMAEMEFEKNYEDAIKYYIEAAKRYTKDMENFKAANCYIFAKDYLNAAKNYIGYAQNNLKMNRFFQAGDGYRRTGDAYRKLRKDYDMKDAYNKAIHNYFQYIEHADYVKKEDDVNRGIANKNIAECYIESEDSPHAKKHLDEALKDFKERKEDRYVQVTEALMRIVDSDYALKSGDYDKADTLLKESIKMLDESIKEGNWPQEYTEFLQHNKERVQETLNRINVKPDVHLAVEQPKGPLAAGRITLKGRITNNSKYAINNLYFLASPPHGFHILNEGETIPLLEPGEARDVEIELETENRGRFSFSPMEILYKDKDGNKYMKGSNEITLEIAEV